MSNNVVVVEKQYASPVPSADAVAAAAGAIAEAVSSTGRKQNTTILIREHKVPRSQVTMVHDQRTPYPDQPSLLMYQPGLSAAPPGGYYSPPPQPMPQAMPQPQYNPTPYPPQYSTPYPPDYGPPSAGWQMK